MVPYQCSLCIHICREDSSESHQDGMSKWQNTEPINHSSILRTETDLCTLPARVPRVHSPYLVPSGWLCCPNNRRQMGQTWLYPHFYAWDSVPGGIYQLLVLDEHPTLHKHLCHYAWHHGHTDQQVGLRCHTLCPCHFAQPTHSICSPCDN